jgi:hypothetical protein
MENNGFSFTYSAKEQEEIKKIREKYTDKSEDKMERVRRLDEGVTTKSTVCSLVLGIVGALILGVGMCCVLVWGSSPIVFALGIVIGLIGIVPIMLAYPAYIYITKKERKRIAPEIIRLTDELLK